MYSESKCLKARYMFGGFQHQMSINNENGKSCHTSQNCMYTKVGIHTWIIYQQTAVLECPLKKKGNKALAMQAYNQLDSKNHLKSYTPI